MEGASAPSVQARSLDVYRKAARGLASPVGVASVVTLVYLGLMLAVLAHHRSVDDFAFVGSSFVDRSGTSAEIKKHAHATKVLGYDGQFALFIALDPTHAKNAIDAPAYRYSHIVYPAVARGLVLGNDDWVPAALPAVNLLAVFAGTLALGLILRRQRRRPALAAFFGLFAGALVSFNRDLSDLLAFSLVALAVLALHSTLRNKLLVAGALFGVAALTRETTLVFPIVLCAAELVTRGEPLRTRLGRAASLLLPAALPYLAWRLFLLDWLGPAGSAPHSVSLIPFGGLLPRGQPGAVTFMNITTIVLPALLLLLVVLGGRVIRRDRPFAAIVAVQILLLVVFLPAQSYADYFAAGRLQLGTLVATLCCIPSLTNAPLRYQQLLGVAAVLAMTPTVVFALAMLGGNLT